MILTMTNKIQEHSNETKICYKGGQFKEINEYGAQIEDEVKLKETKIKKSVAIFWRELVYCPERTGCLQNFNHQLKTTSKHTLFHDALEMSVYT